MIGTKNKQLGRVKLIILMERKSVGHELNNSKNLTTGVQTRK